MTSAGRSWTSVPGLPRHAPGERFLAGPIKWQWLVVAAACGTKALHVGVALWHLAFLTRSCEVKLTNKVLRELRVTRSQKSRALVAMERAGIIDVLRSAQRAPIVRLKNVPAGAVADEVAADAPQLDNSAEIISANPRETRHLDMETIE